MKIVLKSTDKNIKDRNVILPFVGKQYFNDEGITEELECNEDQLKQLLQIHWLEVFEETKPKPKNKPNEDEQEIKKIEKVEPLEKGKDDEKEDIETETGEEEIENVEVAETSNQLDYTDEERKEEVETLNSETKDAFEQEEIEEVSNEKIISHLKTLKKSELVKEAEEAGFPKEEWGNKNKPELLQYIIEQIV